MSASGKEMDWAQMACHRCLVYLGDLSRYQNELAGVDTELLAERFYYQALSVAPQIGKWTPAWVSQPSSIFQEDDNVENIP